MIFDNNKFRLWYAKERNKGDIYYAESLDAMNWTGFGVVLANQKVKVNAPNVIVKDNGYWMFYSYPSLPYEVNVLFSNDGISWQNYTKNPVASGFLPYVIQSNGNYPDIIPPIILPQITQLNIRLFLLFTVILVILVSGILAIKLWKK